MLKFIALFILLALGGASTAAQTSEPESEKTAKTQQEEPAPELWFHLVGGKKFQVDEVNEDQDGYWYKRGNVWTFVERDRVQLVERSVPISATTADDELRGQGKWKLADASQVENFFQSKFGRPLPMGAFGQSVLHTQWGLDHRNGMDISLHPDSVEGKVLITFLRNQGIPFLAFRGAIPRVATGPHIHIGNPSPRVR